MTDSVLIARMQNRPGVLARIASMFHRRGINIHSLTVAPTSCPTLSEMVLRTAGAPHDLERLALAMQNLIDVDSVLVLSGDAACDLRFVPRGAGGPLGPDDGPI